MTKVLLINPPQPSNTYCTPPLGLMYIAAVLKKWNHEVKILDCPSLPNSNNIQTVITTIQSFKPNTIGITAMTSFASNAYDCIKKIRQIFTGTIIFGGPHVTALKEKVLDDCKEIDIAVAGEGETVIIDIVEGKLTSRFIYGLPVSNLDELPFPSWDLIKNNKYNDLFGTQAWAISSRGCKFNCLFCSSNKNYRTRSPKNVVDEIETHVKAGRKRICYYDDNMALDRNRLIEICNEILQRKIKVQFKMETRVSQIDPILLALLKKAGCYAIAFGIESGTQKVLNFLRKGITIEMITKAVKETNETGIQTIGYFILGNPIETKQDMLTTIQFSIDLDLTYAQFALLSPIFGTPLWDYVKENNLLLNGNIIYFGKDATSIIKHPTMTQAELKDMARLANRMFYMRPKYILKVINRIKSWNDLMATIRGVKVMLS